MLSNKNIDRIIKALKSPTKIYKTTDRFGNIGKCYILQDESQNTLVTITRNGIITAYEPEEKYLKRLLKEGELIWSN